MKRLFWHTCFYDYMYNSETGEIRKYSVNPEHSNFVCDIETGIQDPVIAKSKMHEVLTEQTRHKGSVFFE